MKNQNSNRPIHSDFMHFLKLKDQALTDLYIELREMVLNTYPDCNELLYHTHALTSVYSISERLSDGFCHIPIYTNHLNLGFNKGTLLDDPDNLLCGTGKYIRHIPINSKIDYKSSKVKSLIKEAVSYARADLDKPTKYQGEVFSKIKK